MKTILMNRQKICFVVFIGFVLCLTSFAAGGERVFYLSIESGEVDIWCMDVDGGNKINLTADFNIPVGEFDVAPDGTRIAFSAKDTLDSAKLFKMNIDGSNVSLLYSLPSTNLTSSIGNSVWSPDSLRIAFDINWGSNDHETYIINSDGTGPVEYFITCHCQAHPWSWSTDGTKLLIQYSGGDAPPLYAADIEDKTETFVTYGNHADWNPHPTKICLQRNRDLHVLDLDTMQVQRLTFHGQYTEHTAWSYDGTRILYDHGGPTSILWMINSDGTDLTPLGIGSSGELYYFEDLELPSAYGLKEDAITELEALLAIDTNDDDLEQAIHYIKQSLYHGFDGSEVIWLDDNHIDEEKGADAFQYEQEAVDKLIAYLENDENAAFDFEDEIFAIIENMHNADKLLAEIAIEEAEAASGDSDKIDEANYFLAEANYYWDTGDLEEIADNVFDFLQKAWEKAVESW